MHKTYLSILVLLAPLMAQDKAPLIIDLAGAFSRARTYNSQFVQAHIAQGLAREDRVQAKAAFLPTAGVMSQTIYTQGNGTSSGVFVGNDGVHVYNEQVAIHGELSWAKRAELRRTVAAEAAARARVDIATRGLMSTVAQNYYAVVAAERRQANARRSLEEARQFAVLTGKQERGGEVARADVIKARLLEQQREREAMDAEAVTEKARIGLAVILFADLAQPFQVVDDLRPDAPERKENGELNANMAPETRAAEAAVRQAEAGVQAARSGYYPVFDLDYYYGISANVFALRGPDDRKNLGSVVIATLNVPVWNWGATRSKVRQAELQREQATHELATARRAVQSDLSAAQVEARTARAQLGSLAGSQQLAAESLRLTMLRYRAGESTAFEVTDAQTTLGAARNAYDDGLARYRLALVNLDILMGRIRP